MAINVSMGTTRFDLVLSRTPPEIDLDHTPHLKRVFTSINRHEDNLHRLQVSIARAKTSLDRAQARYKRDFEKFYRSQ